jgi:hypothetical protein
MKECSELGVGPSWLNFNQQQHEHDQQILRAAAQRCLALYLHTDTVTFSKQVSRVQLSYSTKPSSNMKLGKSK